MQKGIKYFLSVVFTTSSLLFVANKLHIHGQNPNQRPLTRILFVFDASQSMLGRWNSDTKISVAVKMLNNMVDSLKKRPDVELGLRIYGHQSPVPPQDCKDTKLEVPIGKNTHDKIKERLIGIKPKGTTPIAYSLEQAAKDFPVGGGRNIIILITDGKEECGGDPCAISKAFRDKGVILKPFIIGIGLDESVKTSLQCVGNYYDATTEETFWDVLRVVITQALNPTTAQINLLDVQKKPTETNVPMTLYNMDNGRIEYNFIHTLNHAGQPDTLYLDNLLKYRLKVHTIPPVEKDNITIQSAIHNIIAVDAPQGSMSLSVKGTTSNYGFKCIVRKAGSMETLYVQDFGSSERYLVGDYDIEILCLPRIKQKNVRINQSTNTNIEIEQPGLLNLQMGSPGYGAIFLVKGKDMEFVTNINENAMNQAIALQPGTYRVVFRFRYVKETIMTKDRQFTILPGQSLIVNLRN